MILLGGGARTVSFFDPDARLMIGCSMAVLVRVGMMDVRDKRVPGLLRSVIVVFSVTTLPLATGCGQYSQGFVGGVGVTLLLEVVGVQMLVADVEEAVNDLVAQAREDAQVLLEKVKRRLGEDVDRLELEVNEFVMTLAADLGETNQQIRDQIDSMLDRVRQSSTDARNQLNDEIEDYVAQLQQRVNNLHNGVENDLDAITEDLRNQAEAIGNHLEERLQQIRDTARVDLQTLVSELRAEAQELESEERDRLLERAEQIEQEIQARLDTLESEWDTVLEDLRDDLASIDRSIEVVLRLVFHRPSFRETQPPESDSWQSAGGMQPNP
jgi:F0F1-type ATP synthase membrane subunit b/b'